MSKGSGAILDGKIVPIVGSPGLVSSTLTWETITQSNFGVDIGLFKNQFLVHLISIVVIPRIC
ncbi:hypothetical protein [Sphingobacterium sp. E70]|uniref:hypothetical protein n=1 Tax=Sphingobacterium sp. E70 TaxID=2853439 RepID=UPI00359C6081